MNTDRNMLAHTLLSDNGESKKKPSKDKNGKTTTENNGNTVTDTSKDTAKEAVPNDNGDILLSEKVENTELLGDGLMETIPEGHESRSWAITQIGEAEYLDEDDNVEEKNIDPDEQEIDALLAANRPKTGNLETCLPEEETSDDNNNENKGGHLLETSHDSPQRLPLIVVGGDDEELEEDVREYGSDDYDTDLEEDLIIDETSKPLDATGKFVYEELCKKMGILPCSYMLRNFHEHSIRMRHHCLGSKATKPLAAAFKLNTVVETLDLTDNHLEGVGGSYIADMLKENMFLTFLNLSDNSIRTKGAHAICDMLDSNTTLRTLILRGNHLNDGDAKRFGEALQTNQSLNSLDLSYNEIGELGGMYIGAGLAVNIALTDIDLSWNGIREKGAIAVANAFKTNNVCECIDLAWNGFSLAGCRAFMNVLPVNTRLRVIDISNNRINLQAALCFAAGLKKNTGIETMMLNMNPMGEEGVEAIVKAMSSHPNITMLGMEDIVLTARSYHKLKELGNSRDNLLVLHGEIGGFGRANFNNSIMLLFDKFIMENCNSLEDLFNQLDKDKSGDVTLVEMKYGLKDCGLRLTSSQLDILLEEIDADKSGTIEFDELLDGVTERREKRERDAMLAEKEANTIIVKDDGGVTPSSDQS